MNPEKDITLDNNQDEAHIPRKKEYLLAWVDSILYHLLFMNSEKTSATQHTNKHR